MLRGTSADLPAEMPVHVDLAATHWEQAGSCRSHYRDDGLGPDSVR